VDDGRWPNAEWPNGSDAMAQAAISSAGSLEREWVLNPHPFFCTHKSKIQITPNHTPTKLVK
jgi:hypothetical protein